MRLFRTSIRVFLFVSWLGISVSCVDHSYDFDRTDRSVTLIGETITIPLSTIGPLTVESLLGDQAGDFLVPQSDGTLSLQYKGKPVSFSFDELKNIDGAAPFARFCDMPISYNFALFHNPEDPVFDDKGEADLSGSIPSKIRLASVSRSLSTTIPNLPKELYDLKSITLTPNSRVEITVSIPGCPFISGTVTPEIELDMGTLFVSDEFPGGVIKLTPQLDSKNGYSVTQTVSFHKFALAPNSFDRYEHTINVDASVKFNGMCTISNPRTNRTLHEKAPEEIQLQITANMRDIACKEIEGAFDYSRKSQVTFSLGDFAAGMADMMNGDVFFEFDDPTILIDIQSNITIPISATLDMAARQNRVTFANVRNIPVVFPLATPGSTVSKRFRMSKFPEPLPGEEPVSVDFTELLSRIPDDMLITANASTQSDKTAVLRIGETYKVTLSPQVIIPLSLGPETKVEMRDTIAMSAGLGSLLQDNTFQVVGNIVNNFPLDIAFNLVMTDASGTPLTDMVRQVISADSTSGILLTLSKKSGVDLDQLSSAILSFSMNGISGSRPIKVDDAVQANLHIVIPGGYHFSF